MDGLAKMMGGCLCRAVRFSAVPKRLEHSACHCAMCRKWCSGPFMSVECDGPVEIEDDANVAKYRSSEWAERWFCATCGTALFYKLVDRDYFSISVEAFDESEKFRFVSEIFIDQKPTRYEFANDVPKMTGAEVFEAFKKSHAGETDNGS
jgi:hypothetical protein